MGSTLEPAIEDPGVRLPSRAALLASSGAIAAAMTSPQSVAATLPAGFVETRVASGLASPTAMTRAADGRIFVCEQGGALRVIKDGVLLPAPVLTVSVDASGERGLLGVALDPAFASNGYVYVYYTATSAPRRNRVARFTAAADVAVPGSEVVIAELDGLSGATNHNGGAIHFGPDGRLYVAVGDNADGSNAQSLATRHGKMLRLNADGSVPGDNPFFSQTTGANRSIWAAGLRNPFTFAFERGTGRMFINDVGQVSWEEINEGVAGSNYGWPASEGHASGAPDPDVTYPVFAYGHGQGATTGCAITGGAFYDATFATFPAEYFGTYLFSDFCSGWIRRLDPTTGTAASFATGISQPVDLLVSPQGDLYYLARGSGEVWRVSYEAGLESARTGADVDGDGRDDILWRDPTGSPHAWFMNATESVPEADPLPSPDLSWQVEGLGDFDGDGQSDLLWRHGPTGATYVWLMSGAVVVGHGFTTLQADHTWRITGIGDIDGDPEGTADILLRHESGALFVWQMGGIAVTSSGPLPAPAPGWRVRGIGDLDGDGRADILWRHVSSGTTYLWFLTGRNVADHGLPSRQEATDWHVVGIVDLDGDTRSDVVWRRGDGALSAWLMDGPAVTLRPLPPADLSWQIGSVGDFDGDGEGDLFWRHRQTGATYVWLLSGSGVATHGFTSLQAPLDWILQPPPD